jgi:AraC-like DNA-binding protein
MDANNYQLIEHEAYLPFHILNITWESQEDAYGDMRDVLEHWHEDVEIIYTLVGHAVHYIDGCRYQTWPVAVYIVNSESIHKVISDREEYHHNGETIAVVLQVSYPYLAGLIPDIRNQYFLTECKTENAELNAMMLQLSAYADTEQSSSSAQNDYNHIHVLSLVDEIIYQLCRDRLVLKEKVLPINSAKNLERLRGIMQYVEQHYTEKLNQNEIARRFYFSKGYFAGFFKKNTGLTFMEYLTRYRLSKARMELLHSDSTILDVALNNGFSDARSFINSFRKLYGNTPLQYRKANKT